MSETTAPAGKRRPKDEDLDQVLYSIASGASLKATCEEMGLDTPSTHRWLESDDDRRQSYARAREMRAEIFQEQALEVGLAAATGGEIQVGSEKRKVDASGARVLLDAIKWAAARMAPKTAPVTRLDVTSRARQMTDEEIAAELAMYETRGQDQDDA